MHGHKETEPCGPNCPVGGADGRVRIHLDNDSCNHRDGNVCPACAELTDAEAAAVREYFDQLKAQRGHCRACGAELHPPNATTCRVCHASDTDET